MSSTSVSASPQAPTPQHVRFCDPVVLGEALQDLRNAAYLVCDREAHSMYKFTRYDDDEIHMSELRVQINLDGPAENEWPGDTASMILDLDDQMYQRDFSPSKEWYLCQIAMELRKVAKRWNTIADAVGRIDGRRKEDGEPLYSALAWEKNGQPAEVIREGITTFLESYLNDVPEEIRKRFTLVPIGEELT